MFTHSDQITREIDDAAHIAKAGDIFISCASVSVSNREVDYLDIIEATS